MLWLLEFWLWLTTPSASPSHSSILLLGISSWFSVSPGSPFWAYINAMFAGCGCAIVMATLLFFMLIKSLSAKYPRFHLKNVDDVSLQVVGTIKALTKALGGEELTLPKGPRHCDSRCHIRRSILWRRQGTLPTTSLSPLNFMVSTNRCVPKLGHQCHWWQM